MDGYADRRFTALSGGERVVLDEPANHLDIRHQIEPLTLMRAQRGTALVSLHDLTASASATATASVCDRPHVLYAGAVLASGRPTA